MNTRAFFDAVRTAFGKLTVGQVDGFTRILDEWERRLPDGDIRWLAYMLATTWLETARKMQPIREMGGEKYLRSKRYYPWVGEGLVQVTWAENHRKFGATKPGQMLTWPIALEALFRGMTEGMFTGKKLADYIAGAKCDYVGARKIINGTDKAAVIAGYAKSFEAALTAARSAPAPSPVPTQETPPAASPVAGSYGAIGAALVALIRSVLAIIGGAK